MSTWRWRAAAVGLGATGVLGCFTAVFAAPAALRAGGRPMAVSPPRTVRSGGSLVFRAPLRLDFHAVTAEGIHPLPLLAKPAPRAAVPLIVPRLGFAAPAALSADACGESRPAMQWSVIPATPFVPVDCLRDATLSREPTSLVPGQNKNALYGRGYAPRDLGNP